MLFWKNGGKIAELITQRMGANATGSSGRLFCNRNDDLGCIRIYCAGSAKIALAIDGDLQIGTGNHVADRRKHGMIFSILSYKIDVAIIGFHRFLQKAPVVGEWGVCYKRW